MYFIKTLIILIEEIVIKWLSTHIRVSACDYSLRLVCPLSDDRYYHILSNHLNRGLGGQREGEGEIRKDGGNGRHCKKVIWENKKVCQKMKEEGLL